MKPRFSRRTVPVGVIAAVCVAWLTGACGGPDRVSPAGIEQLATDIGCVVDARHAGSDFEQASCRREGNHLVLLSFAGDEGQRAWLAGATPYGGHYLVGAMWVVVANDAAPLTAARDRLGGDLRQGDHHGH